ncbi:MAG: hypothetical protein VB120_02930 [Lachnospiraceae bacterium]|nr:hypothetical protein [Lachnospiraceae bacterium]
MPNDADIKEKLLYALDYAKKNEKLFKKTEKLLKLNTVNFDKYVFAAAVLFFAAALFLNITFLYLILPLVCAVIFDCTKKPIIVVINIIIAIVAFSLIWVYVYNWEIPVFELYSRRYLLVAVAVFYIVLTIVINAIEKSCLKKRKLKKLVLKIRDYYNDSPSSLNDAIKPEHFTISNINTLIGFYDKGYTMDYSSLYDTLDKTGLLISLPFGGGL